jgi:hypothetical protein
MPFRQLLKSPYQYFKNRKNHESDDKQNKRKKYEENRKARKFNMKWLTNREWLDYDESNDIMTCKTVLGLHWTFGPLKVELLPDQISFYWTKKN